MTVKEERMIQMRDDFIYYIENTLAIKDKKGNIVDIKLNSTQIRFLQAIIEKHFKCLQANSRIRRSKHEL